MLCGCTEVDKFNFYTVEPITHIRDLKYGDHIVYTYSTTHTFHHHCVYIGHGNAIHILPTLISTSYITVPMALIVNKWYSIFPDIQLAKIAVKKISIRSGTPLKRIQYYHAPNILDIRRRIDTLYDSNGILQSRYWIYQKYLFNCETFVYYLVSGQFRIPHEIQSYITDNVVQVPELLQYRRHRHTTVTRHGCICKSNSYWSPLGPYCYTEGGCATGTWDRI